MEPSGCQRGGNSIGVGRPPRRPSHAHYLNLPKHPETLFRFFCLLFCSLYSRLLSPPGGSRRRVGSPRITLTRALAVLYPELPFPLPPSSNERSDPGVACFFSPWNDGQLAIGTVIVFLSLALMASHWTSLPGSGISWLKICRLIWRNTCKKAILQGIHLSGKLMPRNPE